MVKRMTLAQALRLGATLKGPKPSKFRNIAVRVGGRRFASKAEAKRDGDLDMQQRAGLISGLRRQVPFKMVVNGQLICTYVVDWTYFENGDLIGEDKKGAKTPVFILKWKLAHALHPDVTWRLS